MLLRKLLTFGITAAILAGCAHHAPTEYAYVVNIDSGHSSDISAYRIDPASGAMTPVPGSPFPAGQRPSSIAIDPSGMYAYVVNQNSNDLRQYSIDAASGALTLTGISTAAQGQSSGSGISVDPTGRFAFVVGSSNVSVYSIDSTKFALTPVPGSPFPTGGGPIGVSIDSKCRYAYVFNDGDNNISAFSIDPNTGELTPVAGSPFPAGNQTESLAIDPSDSFAYVASYMDDAIGGYSLDSKTGALTQLMRLQYKVIGSPAFVAIDPSGQFIYAGIYRDGSKHGSRDSIAGFRMDAASGALTPVPGSPLPLADEPVDFKLDPTGKFVYVVESNAVAAYSIDATTGALTQVAGSPFKAGSAPVAIAVTRPK